jgi:ABC-2 type transport system permease protein
MSVAVALPRPVGHPAPLRNGYRFELVKLMAQWRIRLLFAACWLGPGVFVAVVSQQSSLPEDTIFGRWMTQTRVR